MTTPAQAKAALDAYKALKPIVRSLWLASGSKLNWYKTQEGVAIIDSMFYTASIVCELTFATDMNAVMTYNELVNACKEGEWDDVDDMLDTLFRKHLMAAKEAK